MKKSILVLLAAFAVGAVQAQDTLKKIKDSGSVTMGVRESSGALAYTLGDGKYTGFHYEVCQHVLGDIQKQLGLPKLDIKHQPVTSQNRIPLVTTARSTSSAARRPTTRRARSRSPSRRRPSSRSPHGGEGQLGHHLDQPLNGKPVATTTGTTSVQTDAQARARNGIDFKEVFGKDHADSFLMLESGRADAFVMDDNMLAGLIANSKNPNDYAIVGEVLTVEPIGIMIRKDDPAFKKVVDDTIKGYVQERRDRQALRQVVHAADPAVQHEGRPAGERGHQGGLGNPNDKPAEDYAKK